MSPTVSLTALLPFRTEAFLAAHRESRSGLTIARRPRPHRMWSTRSAGSPAPAVSLGRRALACARGGGRALGARRLPEATRRGGRSAGAPRKRHVRCQRSGKEGERERGERNKEGEEREKAKERERERVRATSLTTAHHGTAGSADRQAPQPWPPCDAARSQRQRAAGRRGSESRRG
ncbi:unnamed protein product [Prorocentrum cordatum]|uniref:Uncharacterized protein n=1 Tax=Prorocentrum cordatum TaxID=2364126 RepID=A0ABN9SJZ0_9DINO|nr:unnamed protein product [Polarella glacialis]